MYDSVSAYSRLIFEFIFTQFQESPYVKSIPTNIQIKITMDTQGSKKDSMGRTLANFYLEQGSKRVRYGEADRRQNSVDEPPQTYFPNQDVGTTIEHKDGKEITMSFDNVPIEVNKVYRIRMYVLAAASSTLKYDEYSSHASAHIMMDPSIQFSPDFQYPDNYKVIVSSDLINPNLNPDTTIELEMEQGGKKVTKIEQNGGPVTFSSPMLAEHNDDTDYVWSAMNSDIYDIDGNCFDNTYTFDPSGLRLGTFLMNLITFPPLSPNRGMINFELVSTSQTEEVSGDFSSYILVVICLIAVLFIIIYLQFVKPKSASKKDEN